MFANLRRPRYLHSAIEALGLRNVDKVTLRSPIRVATLLKKAYRIAYAKESGWPIRLSTLAYELLLEVANSHSAARYPKELILMMEYISAHLADDLSRETLCKIGFVSKSTLGRMFRAFLNISPTEYVITCRMRVASTKLTTGTVSIAKIALEVGYEDPLYFSAEFRKRMGIGPRAYQKQAWS